MPTKALKGIAKETGTKLKTVEKAEKIAKKEYGKDKSPDKWKKIMGTAKKIAENKKKSEKK